MKCQQCGQACIKRPREATWQWEARKFCSHDCSDLGRTTTRVDNESFRGRYRQIKVNGVVTVEEHAERHTWRPITKACCICDAVFTPDKTKRARQQTCSRECMKALIRLRWSERKAREAAA